jgi:predicted DNA-binding transcriptional regulator AlpA
MATAPKLVKSPAQQSGQVSSANSRLLTADDLAKITGLSVETLAQWRSQRRGIPFIKISRNCVRYRSADLDAWLQERIVRVENDPSNARRNN